MKKTKYQLVVMALVLAILFCLVISLNQSSTNQVKDFNNTINNITNISYEIYKSCEENFSLPEHSTLEDCKRVCGHVNKSFCIGDVAEITNNISICYEINDWEIRTFCVARISLNNTMCQTLRDKELIKACLESIQLKKKWMGLS
ncbi:MAG: hypothetical protein J7K31_00115 [Candidatus Aenigmarchaeota archaeon]|nr:hypothetical protein [Candidatus Aenigmarchaeota archaeon]